MDFIPCSYEYIRFIIIPISFFHFSELSPSNRFTVDVLSTFMLIAKRHHHRKEEKKSKYFCLYYRAYKKRAYYFLYMFLHESDASYASIFFKLIFIADYVISVLPIRRRSWCSFFAHPWTQVVRTSRLTKKS